MADYDDGLEMGVPAAYYDTWNRHNSIAFTNYKGLRNAPGENNCFLNSAVQVFWHLDVFRRSYRRLEGHSCMGNSCIFCALKAIFTQFQYSDQSSLQPDTLRKALAETFVDQHRYQLGHMDDAAECFENILRRLHLHVATEHNEDTCTAAHCISHQKFAMTVFDQVVCPCGAKTDPLRFHELVHYVSASALVSQAKQMQETGDVLHPDRFGLLLRNAAAMGDIRNCPSSCGKRVQMRRTLLNLPDVVSIGLIWDSERPSGGLVTDVIRSLGTTILLQDVFHSVMTEDGSRLPKLNLSAVVCYYGKHYSTFVFNTKMKVWIYFDDATVREIGPRWEDVVEKCVRSRYQPLLLLYTNPYPTLLAVQSAPQKTTMHPGYKFSAQVSPDGPKQKRDPRAAFAQQRAAAGRRAVTPGPETSGRIETAEPRRAITPGPEHYNSEPERDGATRGSIQHGRHNSFLVAMSDRPDHRQENQPMIGDYVYSNGAIQPSFNVQGSVYDSQSVVSNNSDPNYQRYTGVGNGVAPPLGVVVPNNDMQRKESFKKGNKAHGDIIRYTVDQQRLPTSADQPLQQRRASRGKHVRSRSQSCEDTLSVSSETNPHVTKTKPRSGAYNMENGKAVHGPVQSGLATLPRKKSDQRNIKTPSPTVVLDSSDQSHERQGSASSTGSVVLNPKYPSNSSRGEYMDQKHFIRKPETGAYEGDYPAGGGNQHWRQVSASSQSSQSTLTPANADTGYPGVSHSHQSSCSSQVSSSRTPRVTLPGGAPPPSNTPDPALDQDYATYNMRHMTEKILCKQRVQRQASSASSMSVRSNTSSSSIESDYMQKPKSKAGKDSLSVEIPYDNLSLESQKDSGYGSSDRNSSSSTGSITMDPFSQYFISRSMIPPKSVNDYSFMQNFTESFKESLANMEKQDSVDSAYEPIEFKGQPPNAYTVNYVQQQQHLSQKATTQSRLSNQNLPSRNINEQNENNRNTYAGHKISKSPPKQSPSSSNRKGAVSVTDNTNVYKIPAPKEIKNAKPSMMPPSQHDVPVPQEKDLINFKSGIQVQDILPGYSEVANQGSEEFYNLCHKAEEMMDRCILAETNVDFSSAINCCNSAVSYLKQAMQLPGVSQQSYVFAQRKHNSCVMKHRSLQKNAPSNLEGNVFSASSETLNSSSANRSSMTSTDSDGSQRDFIQLDIQGKTKTDVFKDKLQNLYKQGVSQQDRGRQGRQPGAKPPPPQRGVSIGSRSIPVKQSNPPCQNSPITGNVNINTNVQRTENLLNSGHLRTNPMNSNTVKSKSAIPDRGVGTPCVSGSSHDSELYQTYLNRQRALAAGARSSGQSSSGTSTPTSSLDGSDGSREMPGSSYVSKSYSKAEIRHILQQNMMHRQQPVGAVPVRVPHQQSPPPAYPGGQHVRPAPPTQDTLVRDNPSSAGITARPGQPPVVKPQIACKPVISGYRPKSVHPTVNSSRSCMPPGDCLNNGSRTIERCSSQPDNLFQQHQRACSSEHTYLIQNSTLGRDKNSWSTYSSQPDLSSSGLEEECPNFPPPASLSAPSTPAHSSENLSQPDCKPSVKDIASRFEASMGQAQAGRYTPDMDTKLSMPHRQRSKSESSSAPKPVLKQKRQRKKPKARAARKSVTFSDSIALIAAAEEGLPPGPAPPPYEEAVSSRGQDRMGWEDTDTYYGYDSDDDIVKVVPAGYHDEDYCDKDSCASSESPVEVSEIMCSLCRKKGAEPGVPYCSNCHFYMSRFQPNR